MYITSIAYNKSETELQVSLGLLRFNIYSYRSVTIEHYFVESATRKMLVFLSEANPSRKSLFSLKVDNVLL